MSDTVAVAQESLTLSLKKNQLKKIQSEVFYYESVSMVVGFSATGQSTFADIGVYCFTFHSCLLL